MDRLDTLPQVEGNSAPSPAPRRQDDLVVALEALCEQLWNGEELDRPTLVRRLATLVEDARPAGDQETP